MVVKKKGREERQRMGRRYELGSIMNVREAQPGTSRTCRMHSIWVEDGCIWKLH